MAIDLMRNFYKGAALRGGLKDSGEAMGGTILDAFKTRQEAKMKFDSELALEKAKKKNEMDLEMQTAEKYAGSGSGKGGFVPKSFKVGSMTMENPKYSEDLIKERQDAMLNRAIESKKAMGGGGESGRIALAGEAIKNVRDIRNILFPDGTPESFKRGIAAESNIFGGFSQEAQDVFRKAGASLSGRQLIQTGVAARPEETEALRQQFAANFKSNPRAAHAALQELEDFYKNYLGVADPSSFFHNQGKSNVETKQKYAEALAKYPNKKNAILAKYKQETGEDY